MKLKRDLEEKQNTELRDYMKLNFVNYNMKLYKLLNLASGCLSVYMDL